MNLAVIQREVGDLLPEEQDRLAAYLNELRRQRRKGRPRESGKPEAVGIGQFSSGRSDVSSSAEAILREVARKRR